MKSFKEKLLSALECSIDDISENRMVDILLDAFEAKKRRISELEVENAQERLAQQADREKIREELRRSRSDPLHGTTGHYYFVLDDRKFVVQIEGGCRIKLFERRSRIDLVAQQLSAQDFASKWP